MGIGAGLKRISRTVDAVHGWRGRSDVATSAMLLCDLSRVVDLGSDPRTFN